MYQLFCDSNCELWHTTAKEYGLHVIRMPYVLDGEEFYYDLGEQTDFRHFYDRMRAGAVPTTSAINEQNYLDYFEPVLAEGQDIYYITFSHKMSATFQSMDKAIAKLKEKYPEREIRTFDSKAISLGTGFQVRYAAEKYRAGATMDELERCIEGGIKGVAMEPAYAMPPRKADANVLYPLYARCEKAGIPMVLTLSFFQGTLEYSDPATVQHVANDFPNLQIVVAHGCYPWIPMIFQVAITNKNVWLLPDIYMLNPTAPGNQMFGDAMKWRDGERILYGSAWPCYNMKQAIQDLERFNFSPEHQEKFFYKNAEKLLGMKLA